MSGTPPKEFECGGLGKHYVFTAAGNNLTVKKAPENWSPRT
jgi:hypothetical protein